ncbi:ABC transporter permease [Streptomyces sp. NPDC088124]|uniref:ABC transporter permease n=1 Tax=Streptomyces sp. NPDC088124 TaxID=3154654 RepID=UPI0034165007
MSGRPAAPRPASAETVERAGAGPDSGPGPGRFALLPAPPRAPTGWRVLPARVVAIRLVTPTPGATLISGKAFASGVKALIQAVVVIVIAAALGVGLTWNPLRLLGVAVAVILGSASFSCLSMTIAGIVLTRDRLMGIGQAITMPLFFASNALYPVAIMPGWLRTVSRINGVLLGAAALGIAAASSLLGRLAR